MDRWQAMRIFVKVADLGSLAAAARALNTSTPSISRSIATLEETIGARLLIRTTRSLKLTAAGEGYLIDCRRILGEIAEAEASAAGTYAQPAGRLVITAPALFGRMHVLPVILEFLDLNPAIEIRTVFVDRVTNLVEEGLDIAVRIAHLPPSGLIARRVGEIRRVVCASPGYFARHGRPGHPSDLRHHQIIGRDGPLDGSEWIFGREGEIRVPVSPRLICNTNDAATDAALAGWGLSRFQSYQVAGDIEAGRLELALEEYERAPVPVHLIHAEGRAVSARVRAFMDFAAARISKRPGLGAAL